MRYILLSKRFILITLAFAVSYVLLINFLMNKDLAWQTLFGHYDLSYKFRLLSGLTEGLFTSTNPLNLVILAVVAILSGANFALYIQAIQSRSITKATFGSFFGSFFGIVGSGCLSCGFSVFSFLGIFGSLAYLPFHGLEVSLVAIILLAASGLITIRNLVKPVVCAIDS